MGKSIYDLFGTNQQAEQDGIVHDFGAYGKIRIARMGGSNKNFSRALEERTRPYRRAFENGALDPEIAETILRRVVAETVVLGWEGITDRDGKEIEYSADACEQLFTALPDLYADVRQQAQAFANYRKGGVETDAKN